MFLNRTSYDFRRSTAKVHIVPNFDGVCLILSRIISTAQPGAVGGAAEEVTIYLSCEQLATIRDSAARVATQGDTTP